MDPLSAAASVVAVLQIAGQITVSTNRFLKAGESARAAREKLLTRIRQLEAILIPFQEFLKNNPWPASGTPDTFLLNVVGWLQDCNELLNKFYIKLRRPNSTFKSIFDRLTWPLKEQELQELGKLIDQHSITSVLGLLVNQTYVFED